MGDFAIYLLSTLKILSLVVSKSLPSSVTRHEDLSHGMVTNTDNDGFGILFQTNKEQMLDVPIFFSKPLSHWLKGTLVRNGMGQFENGPRVFDHAFDGFAKLASWKFLGNGTVLFSTRFIKSHFYKDSMQQDTIAPYLLFQSVSPPFGFFERLKCLARGIDNMNINVYELRHPKNKRLEYVALSDFWLLYRIDINLLSTKYKQTPVIKKSSLSVRSSAGGFGYLHLLSSAHPLPEPGTNNLLTYLCSVAVLPWEQNTISLIRVKSWKRRRVIATWNVDQVPYMHSFSVTQTKAIILASPFLVDITCMASKAMPFSCVKWYPDMPATLYIVELSTGHITSIEIPCVFTMHHVNAYDHENNQIIMDISSYPSPDFVTHLKLSVLRDPVKRNTFEAQARLKRITIDLTKKTAKVVNVGEDPNPGIASLLDMPVINEDYRSKHYCYVYGLVVKTDNISLSSIAVVKKDMCNNGRHDRAWQVPGTYPAEPWFVPTPQAEHEDDGILMVQVLRGYEAKAYLVILDAKTLTVVNEAKIPTVIPYSLHGRFFNSS